MRFYDRVLGLETEVLPRDIQLGRYYFLDGPYQGKDLTCRLHNDTENHLYFQELLDDRFVCTVLQQIDFASRKPDFVSVPFLQGISEYIKPKPFEEKLLKKLDDIKHMCMNPASKLDKEIQKVSIGKAKRISNRGYEYLACHTEDWNYKSIVSFKPNRVLSEILEEDFNIYENRLLVSFVYRVIEYLDIRLSELGVIKNFLAEYQKCLSSSADTTMHYKKRERNVFLFISVYDYRGTEGLLDTSKSIVSNSINKLKLASQKLKKYLGCNLFEEIRIKKGQKLAFHETNILTNDRHYKSLRMLWKEFEGVYGEKSEEEKIIDEQNIITSMRTYALSLICFTCTNYLGYRNLMGNTHEWVSSHEYLPNIHVFIDEQGIIHLKIGNQPTISLIVIGTDKGIDCTTLKENEYILSYGNIESSNKIIKINVKDVDSTERIGSLIRKYIIKVLISKIRHSFTIDISSILNYSDLLKSAFMSPIIANKYHYIDYPSDISISLFEQEFENSPITYELKAKRMTDWKHTVNKAKKVRINPAYDKAKYLTNSTIQQINVNSVFFRESLTCPKCGKKYDSNNISKFKRFHCPNCDFELQLIHDNEAVFMMKNVRENISDPVQYFGMDYVELSDI